MKAHKEFRDTLVLCENCGKEFYPRYVSRCRFCSRQCSNEYRRISKYKEYINNPNIYTAESNMKWIKSFILEEQR